ncbi:GNAT family N-acetyltransferase [Alsobacter sp. SYSU M60028]|uniref:GNAT family N-acetyltransferase n=1 Tax=Alsobacter ponti TaxID=2962936 RepID=A0ABT1LFZ1_9HYPH|nr:GNAT family N-acetyltransferase [Alsobacter ponti]MCP8939168.1 GNAT family N-acetyltransferase [Alsobacter ponti]
MSPLPQPFAPRDATDADGPALARLIASVFAEYEGCPFVPEEFPELAAPASHFAGKGGRLWVVEAQGEGVIGSLAVAPTHVPGVFELFKVYLARAHRGQGVAAALLRRAEDFAAAAGGERFVLWSDTRFTAGHRFYARHGFRRVAGLRALHDVAATLEFGFERAVRGARP